MVKEHAEAGQAAGTAGSDSKRLVRAAMRKPPPGVMRALRKISQGRHPAEGIRGRSEFGGWTATYQRQG